MEESQCLVHMYMQDKGVTFVSASWGYDEHTNEEITTKKTNI